MVSFPLVRFVLGGALQRDFIITSQGDVHLDIPGGNLLYAAAGLGVWEKEVGLIGKVGEDYPQNWLTKLNKYNFDTRGISIAPEAFDLRGFIFYLNNKRYQTDNPIAQFAQLGLPIPKSLLGYIPASSQNFNSNDKNPPRLRLIDIPPAYSDATAAHLCPLDLENHQLLVSHLRQSHVNTITLDPSEGYIKTSSWNVFPKLLEAVNILLISEEKISALFRSRSTDLWEMAEALAAFGCESIVIKRGKEGQFIYDCHAKKRWIVPAYPAKVVDVSGCGDAFCGGFLAGYRKTYDPLEAALYGNISASITIEGIGPFYALDSLPGLSAARLEKLRSQVRST